MATMGRGTKMKEIFDNPTSLAIIEKYIPGISTGPGIEQAYALPLKLTISFKDIGLAKDQQKALIAEIEAANIEV
jgi:hypothetical protein